MVAVLAMSFIASYFVRDLESKYELGQELLLNTVEALLMDTLVSGQLTYDHLHKTLFELPYKLC